ncbi:cyclic nucleotide-gated cation channel beta-1 [Dorcoceras hygrometricum]|uniref:Cyclic nucleotide-gated cation channel beta-1 n=1 Tax=Dorcoceras hygrometricum TaxID=472368 RepID=A0A2Z7BWL4_9LAMI|nr:cyclic nucleotide-gated cation channel beta-1 [Dorcoceras hygrometricum]
MSRQSPSRNQRSNGIKIKHGLQICLLVAICFWLAYQVKHSHERKKEFDESDKVLLRRESTDGMIKLGRKDIHSEVTEAVFKNAVHVYELEDKNEEDEQGEEKSRGNENEGQRGEEEEIDDHEREKLETEIDREEDFVDDEEGENGDDQENEERHSEDSEKDVSVEDVDRDGDDRSNHEAQEEHYKADDVSSAVTHDTQIDTENLSEHLNLVLRKEKKGRISEETNTSKNRKESGVENRKEVGVENGERANGSNWSDVTIKETLLGNSKNSSFSNNTLTEGSQHCIEVDNTSTEARSGSGSSSLGDITENISSNAINGSISMISTKTKGVDSKSELSSTSNDADSFESVKINTWGASMDTGDGKNDISDSKMPEIFEEVQHGLIDFSDTSNSLEDNDVPANI